MKPLSLSVFMAMYGLRADMFNASLTTPVVFSHDSVCFASIFQNLRVNMSCNILNERLHHAWELCITIYHNIEYVTTCNNYIYMYMNIIEVYRPRGDSWIWLFIMWGYLRCVWGVISPFPPIGTKSEWLKSTDLVGRWKGDHLGYEYLIVDTNDTSKGIPKWTDPMLIADLYVLDNPQMAMGQKCILN